MKRVLSMLVVVMVVFSLVACDLSSLGGLTTSSSHQNNGGGGETVTVSFKAVAEGAAIVGPSSLEVEKGSELDWTEVPTAILRGFEFVGWAYDINGERMLDIASDVFYSDSELVAIFVPLNEDGTIQSVPSGGVGESDNATDGSSNGSTDESNGSTDESNGSTDESNGSTDESGETDKTTGESSDAVDSDIVGESKDNDEIVDSGEKPVSSNTPNDDENIDAEKDQVSIYFNTIGGEIVDGENEVEINRGGKLPLDMVPQVTKDGYKFYCWAYDKDGEDKWSASDRFYDDTILYAIWIEVVVVPPVEEEPDIILNPVIIEYETGTGYFEDSDWYEVTIEYGSRYTTHKDPVNDNPAMRFTGWYLDKACTERVLNSHKYTEDVTVLYAGWLELEMCTDGTYNHAYSAWEDYAAATCTKAELYARYCIYCDSMETMYMGTPLGHNYGAWQEAFMSKERTCNRIGCGAVERVEYENVTLKALGSSPENQIIFDTDVFYSTPGINLVNGNWDESMAQCLCPKGSGEAAVVFAFVNPMSIDGIYFRGRYVTSVNVFVQYEGEEELVLVGICGSVNYFNDTRIVNVDSSKKVAAVVLVEENPPNGTSQWHEIAFVKTTSGNDDAEDDTEDTPTDGKITIEYVPGVGGYFESADDYEVKVDYNSRYNRHPVPMNEDSTMLFVGWYMDKDCLTPISNSQKYTSNTVLYALWRKQVYCLDGSFNHNFSVWEEDRAASCENYGVHARYCLECYYKETKTGGAPLGHMFGSWQEAFMSKERVCHRLGCGRVETINYKNITIDVLGNNPSYQINGNVEAFYNASFTNLINGNWDDDYTSCVCPRGTGDAHIQFDFVTAETIDRIYFKGNGIGSVNVYVLYDGEDEFALVGIVGSADGRDSTPYVELDNTRSVVAVKLVEKNPPQGTSQWQEVAFVKKATE